MHATSSVVISLLLLEKDISELKIISGAKRGGVLTVGLGQDLERQLHHGAHLHLPHRLLRHGRKTDIYTHS